MQNLHTKRLHLRPFTLQDVDFVFEVHTHPGVARFLPQYASSTRAGAENLTRRFMGWVDDAVHGVWCVTRHEGTPVALVMLKPIPASQGVNVQDVEIGWRGHPDHGGQGFVTEAATRMLQHAFETGHERVVAVTDPENEPSMVVCRRLGMSELGRTHDYYDKETLLFVAWPPGSASRLKGAQ